MTRNPRSTNIAQVLRYAPIKREAGQKFHFGKSVFGPFGSDGIRNERPFRALTRFVHAKRHALGSKTKAKRIGPESRADALGEVRYFSWPPVF
jgi:hypothetical protein